MSTIYTSFETIFFSQQQRSKTTILANTYQIITNNNVFYYCIIIMMYYGMKDVVGEMEKTGFWSTVDGNWLMPSRNHSLNSLTRCTCPLALALAFAPALAVTGCS
jgi:hypothetical protein